VTRLAGDARGNAELFEKRTYRDLRSPPTRKWKPFSLPDKMHRESGKDITPDVYVCALHFGMDTFSILFRVDVYRATNISCYLNIDNVTDIYSFDIKC